MSRRRSTKGSRSPKPTTQLYDVGPTVDDGIDRALVLLIDEAVRGQTRSVTRLFSQRAIWRLRSATLVWN